MNAQQIIDLLSQDGITLSCENGNLRVTASKSCVTEMQKMLIATNKSLLVEHLKPADERNPGSLESEASAPVAAQAPPAASSMFKEYTLDNGEVVQLTRDEFDRVVDLFRQLHRQSQKLDKKGGAA